MKKIIVPPYLKNGDTIGMVCPAGHMPKKRTTVCIKALESQGFNVVTGPTVGGQSHYFSGTDAQRAEDFQRMLDDKKIKAILCGRGGYGVSRIIDLLDFHQFKKHPKWISGFSDITLLHTHLNHHLHTASLHAPMAGAFDDYGADSEFNQTLFAALRGDRLKYAIVPHRLNRRGEAEGELIGGNLSLLVHAIGSNSEPETKGKILFMEDVGEYIYAVDRMLIQLKRAGKLDQLAGLVIGSFSEMKDTTVPFGQDIYEAIHDKIKEYTYPVVFNFPVGHTERNVALREGLNYRLSVTKKKAVLEELK